MANHSHFNPPSVWQTRLSRLALLAVIVALSVIILGAYTRLKDAGLGCPDWPGCYGHWNAPSTPEAMAAANAAYPDLPVELNKARTEMTHRMFAEGLGSLIMLLGVFSFIQRKKVSVPVGLAGLLMLLVVFQGLLGMWTVTLRLLPLTVMGHLLGGFATLTLLWLYWLTSRQPFALPAARPTSALRVLSVVTLVALIFQIFLGGWTSANYAALICPDFPTCQGQWWPTTDFSNAFNLLGGLGMQNPLMYMNGIDRTTIHLTHRLGALLVLGLGSGLVFALWQQSHTHYRHFAYLIGSLLCLQLALGLANVLLHLPLAIAVAHNAIAALLLLSLVTLLFYMSSRNTGVLCPRS